MTGILTIIVIYIYTIIGFFYLQDTFYDFTINKYDIDKTGENFC